jgi:hypothetical protein
VNERLKPCRRCAGICACLIAGIAAMSCSFDSRDDARVIRITDSWYNPLSGGALGLRWDDLKQDTVHPVPDDAQERAVQKLGESSCVALSEKDLPMYGNMSSSVEPGLKPFLVRGLRFRGTHGAFHVYKNGDKIWVSYGILTHRSPPPEERAPLIVWLDFHPHEVYVGLNAAE